MHPDDLEVTLDILGFDDEAIYQVLDHADVADDKEYKFYLNRLRDQLVIEHGDNPDNLKQVMAVMGYDPYTIGDLVTMQNNLSAAATDLRDAPGLEAA